MSDATHRAFVKYNYTPVAKRTPEGTEVYFKKGRYGTQWLHGRIRNDLTVEVIRGDDHGGLGLLASHIKAGRKAEEEKKTKKGVKKSTNIKATRVSSSTKLGKRPAIESASTGPSKKQACPLLSNNHRQRLLPTELEALHYMLRTPFCRAISMVRYESNVSIFIDDKYPDPDDSKTSTIVIMNNCMYKCTDNIASILATGGVARSYKLCSGRETLEKIRVLSNKEIVRNKVHTFALIQ